MHAGILRVAKTDIKRCVEVDMATISLAVGDLDRSYWLQQVLYKNGALSNFKVIPESPLGCFSIGDV